MQELRQSTAVNVMFGVFVDATDGKTTEEALTLAQADLQLSKNGAAATQKTESTSATHRYGGNYSVPLGATDTGTLGCLELMCKESGALPVKKSFMVVAQNYWDSKYSTDKLQVDVTQIGGVIQSLTDLKDLVDTGYDPATHKVQGVVLTDTTTTNTDMVAAAPTVSEIQAEIEENGVSVIDTIRDYIENVTYGLSALKTLIDGVPTTAEFEARSDLAGTAATPAEVATALTDINLDHLVKIAVDTNFATTVHLDSVVGQLADVGTAATFDRTTDSQEAIRNVEPHGTAMRGTNSAATEAKQDIIDTNIDQIEAAVITNADGVDIAADIIAVKVDTNELQLNQGNWATATGFNTVVPDAAGVAATPAEVATALTNIHLDHLLAVDYDPASKPGVATALLNELIENDVGVSRFTENSLEQAPSGGSAPTVGEIRTEMEGDGSKIDHLWEMTEDDLGIRRLTQNALEQAPSGTGGDASAENQVAMATILKEVNQSLNGAKCVIDRAASTFKVYDTDGTTLLFTITKATVGNVDTLTRT